MKIAIIAPPLRLPPDAHGPIEMLVHDLAEALVERRHKVLVFAAASSDTSARLIPYSVPEPEPNWPVTERESIYEAAGREALDRAEREHVDVVHDHIYALAADSSVPVVHTLHAFPGDELMTQLAAIARSRTNFFVAVSQRQRQLFLDKHARLPILRTVHNGLDFSRVGFSAVKDDFFLFLGRASREKGPDIAIDVAIRAGVPLVMVLSRRLPSQQAFLEEGLRPLARGQRISMLDEASTEEKYSFYRRAKAVLFTPRWEEPFGLVMIEAMACGTPVLAFRRGSAPEIIADGVTGFLCDSEEDMIANIGRVGAIDPVACRAHVERLFTAGRMAAGYESVYEEAVHLCRGFSHARDR